VSSGIPVVDVAGLRSADPAAQAAVGAELRQAAVDNGLCYVSGTGIPDEHFDALLDVTKRFFALPLETKMDSYIGRSSNHRGYVPVGEEVFSGGTVDAKEAFDLALELPADDAQYLDGVPFQGPNQWPRVDGAELPGFRSAVSTWYADVLALGGQLFRGFALAMGQPADFFAPYLTRSSSQLRLIHYPYNAHEPDGGAIEQPGIGAHTDYEWFTLLKPTAPGLQVLTSSGEWIEAPPIPGTFVLNVGDMLELCTNGVFVATSHRVRAVQEERYSFPLFCNLDYETVVAPLPEFVGDGTPMAEPMGTGAHLWGQTVQTFAYLKRQVESGQLVLPDAARPLASFGHPARVDASA
jgi:isopenicillin N synthase-like dioxygenase